MMEIGPHFLWQFLAFLVLGIHSLWIIFIALGWIAVYFRPGIAYIHISGLAFALILNLMGWYCPLTYLENHLYNLGNIQMGYSGSFLLNYLERFIYPQLPEVYVRAGVMLFVCISLGFYARLAIKMRFSSRIRK